MEPSDSVLSASDAARICEHMNAEHADDVLRIAQVYGDEPDVTSATMIEIDAEGMKLEAVVDGAATSLRVTFDSPLGTVEDARRTLVDMALQAREEST